MFDSTNIKICCDIYLLTCKNCPDRNALDICIFKKINQNIIACFYGQCRLTPILSYPCNCL